MNVEEQKPTIQYRPVKKADYPIIMDMYAKLNAHFYKTGYRLPHPENVGQVWLDSFQRTIGRYSNAYIAEIGGEVVGFILCRIKRVPMYFGGALIGELSDMWIVPSARRLGIGEKLSRIALEWLREKRVHSIEIQVLLENEVSWKLFNRMGFKQEFRVARLLWEDYIEDDA